VEGRFVHNSFIFIAHPEKMWDVDGYLAHLRKSEPQRDTINWTVERCGRCETPHYPAFGDFAFLWRCGKDRGVVAFTEIISEPADLEEAPDELEFYTPESRSAIDQWAKRVLIRVVDLDQVKRQFVDVKRIQAQPLLAKMAVLKPGFQHKLTHITEHQATILRAMMLTH
jgi:predicted RNA-binding protein with PUA-like domain